MKKLYTLFMILAVYLFAGCDKNGDHGYYEDRDRVYFVRDSVVCRLGEMPIEESTYTARVPVRVLGRLSGENRTFKLSVDKELTTAPDSIYRSLPAEFAMDKDSINADIPVELLRSKIDPAKNVIYRIVLKLEESDAFGLGVREKLQTKVVFSNYLQEPDWWFTLAGTHWGPYQPEKYQKMMELWGGVITFEDYMNYSTKVILCAKDMYDYFRLHPEYGMVFPEKISWPYE